MECSQSTQGKLTKSGVDPHLSCRHGCGKDFEESEQHRIQNYFKYDYGMKIHFFPIKVWCL